MIIKNDRVKHFCVYSYIEGWMRRVELCYINQIRISVACVTWNKRWFLYSNWKIHCYFEIVVFLGLWGAVKHWHYTDSLKIEQEKIIQIQNYPNPRLCADLTQVLAPLRRCFKNFSNAKPWQRNEFHYQDNLKKKGEIAVYGNSSQLAEVLPIVF